MSTPQQIFALSIERNMDITCPAVQAAIDHVAGEFRGRSGMLQVLRGCNFDRVQFNSMLLTAWKPAAILRATGHTQQWWLELADAMPAQ